MIILVDMDDTIEHLPKVWVKGANDKYDRCVSYDEITYQDVSAAFPGLTHKQVYEIPMQPGFWKTVKAIADASEVLSRLIDAGHEIFIVSATPYQSVFEKMSEVLFNYFPFLSLHISNWWTFFKDLLKSDMQRGGETERSSVR